MRRLMLIVSTLVILFTVRSSARAQEPSVKPQVMAAFVQAFENKDAAGIALLHGEDATLLPPNEPAVKGRARIEQWYQAVFASETSIRMDSDQLVYAGPLAHYTGRYSVLVKCSGTMEPAREMRRFVWTLRLFNSEWRIESHIFNTDSKTRPCK